MVKTTGAPPGQVPQQPLPQQLQQEKTGKQKGLNQKEARQALQQKGEKISSSDAARIASQAGFQRTQKKGKKGGFDIGDGSGQQFSLPQDDVDGELWSSEKLEDAQGSLSLASSQLGELAKAGESAPSMGAALVGSSFMPTEEDLEELEDIAKRKPPKPMPMLEEVSNSVSTLFGIPLDEDVPVGHKVLAAGLVVAGEPESVKVAKGKLEEKELAGGIQKVTKRGNQAVGDAQRMSKGINQQLNLQRTFVFKR